MELNLVNRIIRSGRKTLELEILSDSQLIVRAPHRATMKRIINLVREKLGWIIEKQRYVREKYRPEVIKRFVAGEEFLYLGKSYRLSIIENTKAALDLDDDNFILSSRHHAKAGEFFEKWYRKQAREIIKARVEYHAEREGLKYSRIRISGARRRWGSCGGKGSLNFSWRLIMAPMQIIDYVVIHEIMHLKVKNHKKNFWNEVERLVPDFKQCRKWLRTNGHLLKT